MKIEKILFAAVFLLFALWSPTLAQIAVRGETVYTSAGEPIKDGVVLIRNGKIERVGSASQIRIPADYRTLNAKVVTPGLIDARSVVGLAGALNQPHDQDQLETSSAIQPELRAIDAYNARERLVEYLRSLGVTTLHTGHAPGALISGQTMVVKTAGDGVDEAVVVPSAMIAVTIGSNGLGQGGKPPGTRSKAIAMLRAELIKAADYQAKLASATDDKKPARDLRLETLARVIRREIPLLVSAHRANDILAALRVAREFNIRMALDGASEAYLVIDQIKAAGVPVIIHPTMYRAGGETENLSFETAAALRKAGIAVAIQSGYEGYVPKTRVVLFEAALAAANGMSFIDALAAITINAARILGIAERVGSLEAGKDADLALFDGDPFEYTSHVTGVIINGQVVSQEVK
jgi:imidazolonepropionase-like amidohydrolase